MYTIIFQLLLNELLNNLQQGRYNSNCCCIPHKSSDSANYNRPLPQISPNDALNGIETPGANIAFPNPPSTPAPTKQPRYSTLDILPNTPLNVSGLNSPGIDMTEEKNRNSKRSIYKCYVEPIYTSSIPRIKWKHFIVLSQRQP